MSRNKNPNMENVKRGCLLLGYEKCNPKFRFTDTAIASYEYVRPILYNSFECYKAICKSNQIYIDTEGLAAN